MAVKPKPGSETFRALALIVADPGQWSASDIGAHLRKPAPRDRPFTSAADYAEWRRERQAFERERADWASRMVRRLAEAGFVESRGAPVVAEWFAKRAASVGVERALSRVVPDQDVPLTTHLRLLARVGPSATVAEVIGKKPSGAVKRAWKDLTERWEVVIPPAARWPTEKGRALVQSLAATPQP